MFEKIRKMKNQKGFTLVELIVVLVILAILAAMLVPALTGYIDKANNQKIVAATRQVVMAAQTEISEAYGKGALENTTVTITNNAAASDPAKDKNITGKAIVELAEVGKYDTPASGTAQYKLTNGITKIVVTYEPSNGHVTKLELTQGSKTCTYTEGATDKNNGAYDVQPKSGT